MDERKVISIEELKNLASGELVDLPGFTTDAPFTVRLRRPSVMNLVKSGKIPNELLTEANALFTRGASGAANKNIDDPDMLKNLMEVMEHICNAAFVEPTYKQITEAGIELTDSQLLAVFSYTQNGVEQLKSFH